MAAAPQTPILHQGRHCRRKCCHRAMSKKEIKSRDAYPRRRRIQDQSIVLHLFAGRNHKSLTFKPTTNDLKITTAKPVTAFFGVEVELQHVQADIDNIPLKLRGDNSSDRFQFFAESNQEVYRRRSLKIFPLFLPIQSTGSTFRRAPRNMLCPDHGEASTF